MRCYAIFRHEVARDTAVPQVSSCQPILQRHQDTHCQVAEVEGHARQGLATHMLQA